jgi:serine/threonine protein kinase
MTLSTGTKLVHYEITSEIGRGGMGEVYQAKDTKLGRDVAIKVLPEEFALDKDRVARFQREAKLLASLNHPNIAAIHGLEESEGTHFLVMELIEGDKLRDRIKSGPIPVEEALKLALQMAEGLEAAHEKGIIHRDLKPANIKVTPDGKVKILDFGLAKAYVGDQENMSPMDSPTISAAATQQGVILGTAAYMSPEQAKGKSVDKRADIWAFGVVLFEMLTGKSLFSGEDVTSTLARVLEREPDFSTLPQNLHPRIQLMLERCLKKNLKDRYSGISDARVDIQNVLADSSGVFAQSISTVEPRRNIRSMLTLIAATFIVTAIIVGALIWNLRPAEPRKVTRFFVELPESYVFGEEAGPNLALSSDGSQLAVSTSKGIYLRSMNELNIKLVAGTVESTKQPFFSPDGESIGYWSIDDKQLKKVSVAGGTPITLCKDPNTAYYNWGNDGNIYFAGGNGIMKVSENGGVPVNVIAANNSERFFSPQLLPDGKSIIYTIGGEDEYKIALQSINANDRRILFEGATAQYLPITGHLIYVVGNELQAIPFDIDKLEPSGRPVLIVEDIYVNGPPHFCVSNSGTFAYLRSIYSDRSLVWVDFDMTEELLNTEPDIYCEPMVSPDGTRIALSIQDDIGKYNIGIWDIDRGTMINPSSEMAYARFPNWSDDSERIVFAGSLSSAISSLGVYQMSASGTGRIEHLYTEPGRQIFPTSLSKDGKILLCQTWLPGIIDRDIGMLTMGEDPQWKLLLPDDKFMKFQPQFSPDDQWIAYTSNKSGRNEVYVRSLPEVEETLVQISTNGGDNPLWSPNGSQLYYRNGDRVIATTYETKHGFKVVKSEVLFQGSYYSENSGFIYWDIHPDGDRFLMMKEKPADFNAGKSRTRIDIVLNWDEELKQRVPVD